MKQHVMSPSVRGVFILLSLTGTLLASRIEYLVIFLLCLLLLLQVSGSLRMYLQISFHYLLPLYLITSFIYCVFIPFFMNNLALPIIVTNLEYVSVILLRLGIISAIFFAALVMDIRTYLFTFQSWGLSQQFTLTFLGGLSIFFDVAKKGNKIVDAIYARGMIQKRSLLRTLVILPYAFRPLIINLFNDALARNDTWDSRHLIVRLNDYYREPPLYSTLANVIALTISSMWMIASIILRINNAT